MNTFTNMPISVGLGMYCPYGLSLDWGNNTPFNTVAEKGSLLYLSFNPVIAWKICRTLSIGIGPTINYSQATVQQALDPSGATQLKFDGDGFDYGFNAGILWQPHPMWSFGVNYRSATDINYTGTASQTFGPPFPASTQTSASVKFPQFVVGGISFRPTTDWNFEFDLDWADWSSVRQIDFQNTPFGTIPLTLNFSSSFMYEFGATRQLGKGYFASVGYIYNENSSPDANFTPLIPDATLQLGSIGFGRHGKHWDWAIAYHFGYNGGRTVSNDRQPFGERNVQDVQQRLRRGRNLQILDRHFSPEGRGGIGQPARQVHFNFLHPILHPGPGHHGIGGQFRVRLNRQG